VKRLSEEFERQFDEKGTYRVTVALTSEIEITDGIQLMEEEERDLGERMVVVGLGNIEKIVRQFRGSRGDKVRVFPIAFSRVACGMQGKGPPAIYDRAIERLRRRMKRENCGEDVFRIESFQLYNTLKQQIRSNKEGFYAGQSVLTGATCRMAGQGSVKDRRRQNRMIELMKAGEPFRQIIQGSEHAEREGRVRVRMEPVVSIEMLAIEDDGWDEEEGKWDYVVRSIMGPLFEAIKNNVREICFEMIDIYSPEVRMKFEGQRI
jgi:hypothetical protein